MATEVVLENFGVLNIEEGTNFPLNYNIQDLTKPESTPSSYSKDVVIVGNADSNKILGQAFDVNISDSSFDVNKKVPCNVIQDEANVFEDGFFQLLKVTKTGEGLPNGDPKVLYKGRVKSNLMSFFTSIKDQDLTDLKIGDASTYTILNKQNVKATFSNNYTDRWKFVPGYRQNSTVFKSKFFKPGIYAKTFFDAIHEDNGWQYEFGELSDVRFDKLIIPYTGEYSPSDETKEESSVFGDDGNFYQYDYGSISKYEYGTSYSNNHFQSTPSGGNGLPVVQMNNELRDSFNQYNPSNSRIKADFTCDYTVRYEIDFTLVLNNPNVENVFLDGYIDPNDPAVRDTLGLNAFVGMSKYSDGGILLQQLNSNKVEITSIDVGENLPNGDTSYQVSAIFQLTVPMNATDELRGIRLFLEWVNKDDNTRDLIWKSTDDFNPRAIGNIFNVTNTILTVQPELEYNTGTPIYLQDFIPKDVSQRDFVKSIIDAYKLTVDIDPNQENKLIYKTRDKYYDDGKEVDWRDKIASDRPINLEWLVDKQPKKKKFTYKQDEDKFNKAYFNEIRDIYGEYEFDYGNDYNVGEEKLELIFSPTPVQYSESTDMYLPSLPIGETEDELNIRILYDGGLRTGYWFFQDDDGTNPSNNESDYPYFGHFDDPVNPGFDINFGVCEFYFYNQWNLTTQNNLWNLFHRRYTSQLVKGRLMTAYFNLTPTDILKLKLNDKIYVDNSWWNINKVIDYNANSNSLTKVELVTVDDGLSIKPSFRDNVLEPGPSKPGIARPSTGYIEDSKWSTNTISKGYDGTVYGEDNIVSGQSTGIVIGDNNTVSGDSLIVGDNSSDGGHSSKLVIGDNKTADADYDAVIGDTKIGEKINIGEVDYTDVGMVYDSAYVADGYVADGYFESFDAGVTFDPANDGTINMQGSEISMDITELNFTNTTTVDFTNVSTANFTGVNVVGTGFENAEDITRSNLLNLISTASLTPGKSYHITDNNIYLVALDENLISEIGIRVARVIKDTYYTPQTISGAFEKIYLGIYGQTIDQGSVPNSGISFGSDQYRAIWGGKMWERNAGTSSDGGASTQHTIDSGWVQVSGGDVVYRDAIFEVHYDIDADRVTLQKDWKGNVVYDFDIDNVNGIEITDWGNENIRRNEGGGITNNWMKPSSAAKIRNNNIYGVMYFNAFETDFSFNQFGSNVYNNDVGAVYGNYIEGFFRNNERMTVLYNDVRFGNFENNNTNRICRENICFGINDNVATSTGDITIRENKINGPIDGNLCASGSELYIQNNINNGGIYRNSVPANIPNGYTVFISFNNNNGNIGTTNSNTNRTTNVQDPIVNK